MATHNNLLFSWNNVEQLPDFQRLKLVLDNLPDEALLEALQQQRGRGRNDFPVQAMWRATIAGIVFQHDSVEHLVRELHRNLGLLQFCGFHPLPRQSAPVHELRRNPETGKSESRTVWKPRFDSIPHQWNFTRFFKRLISLEHKHGMMSHMIWQLREQLMDEIADFGTHLGYDGKALNSYSSGRMIKSKGRTSDADANWGRHEYGGVDKKTGKSWSKIKSWFGYSLHVIGDTRCEIPLAVEVTKASASEPKQLETMLTKLFEQTPQLATRCREFSADRGLDSGRLKATLWDAYRIRPIIDLRQMWREEKNMPGYDPTATLTRALFEHRADNIVYDESGQLHCQCPQTAQLREMSFYGFEERRNTLKYRSRLRYTIWSVKAGSSVWPMPAVRL